MLDAQGVDPGHRRLLRQCLEGASRQCAWHELSVDQPSSSTPGFLHREIGFYKVVLSMASAPAAEIADRLVRVAYAASQSLNEPLGHL